MPTATNPAFQRSLEALATPGIAIGHRLISAGDELALLPDERVAFATSVDKVRRASGAARIVARELMAGFGQAPSAVLKAASGAPIWPADFVGSLAHDQEVAVAAMARRRDAISLGIDVEPAQPLDTELLNLVATSNERARMPDHPNGGRLLFAIKEAVYKCAFPLDDVFLEHHDVEVDFAVAAARTRTGRTVQFRYNLSERIVVLALA